MLQENITRQVPKWIKTYTGKKFYPLDPEVELIDIKDIAHSLSNQCRFTGHSKFFYSVCQHSIHVSNVVKMNGGGHHDQMWGLLHDASEAYAVDLPSPVKNQVVGYADVERRIMSAVALAFGLPDKMPDIVKDADEIMLATEARDLMGNPDDWNITHRPVQWNIKKMDNETVSLAFIDLFNKLNRMIKY